MSRNYTILYLEDLRPDSIVSELEGQGLQVKTVDVDNDEEVNKALGDRGFQAFLMDYRLTSKSGHRDAPELVGRLRTQAKDGEKSIEAPIILISEESQLRILRMPLEIQDQYDEVMSKKDFLENAPHSAELIRSFIEAYGIIRGNRDNLATVLGIDEKDKNLLIDYRLEADYEKLKEDVFASSQLLYNFFVRSTGSLIDDRVLAARLGIDMDKSGYSWDALKELLTKDGCHYEGVMHTAYSKWWMEKVRMWWEKTIPEKKSFRYEDAETRVELLNSKVGLKLVVADPIEKDMSHEFWNVCMATGKPLDPSDGYVCNRRFKREWEEDDFISLKGALENPKWQQYLSKIDRRDILVYGEKSSK